MGKRIIKVLVVLVSLVFVLALAPLAAFAQADSASTCLEQTPTSVQVAENELEQAPTTPGLSPAADGAVPAQDEISENEGPQSEFAENESASTPMVALQDGQAALQTAEGSSNENDPIIVDHDPYKHAKDSYVRQAWGPNTVLIHCDWEYQFPASFASEQICQFHEWPLIVMSRPDDYYDGKPKEAYFNWMTMKDYPFGKQYEGFPHDFAEWDGTFTYTGINGTVEYGPTDKAPIGEGTYYVYAKVRIPSAVTVLSDGTFILGKTFTIEPSSYKVKFDANVPNGASTTATGTMPELSFNSRVEPRQLPPNQFILPGYAFDSWNTKEDGSGERYGNNALVKDLSYAGKDVTLYARWKPKEYTITYYSGAAGADPATQSAFFDMPGKLTAIAELGWSYANHVFLGWATDGFALLYDDQEDYVNLGGPPTGYYQDPPNAVLTAQWAANGQIIVVVTKDGVPQDGLAGCFTLKANGGTVFSMPATYTDGKYVFDPSQARQPGGDPTLLPPGDYELFFTPPVLLGSAAYPKTSARITYGSDSATRAVFDYYTVTMVADPAFKDACTVAMEPVDGANLAPLPNVIQAIALDGATLKLKTTAQPGYHFDGYSATGVAPKWEGNDPMKAEQTIEVQGQAAIMAHVAANTYTVLFDANTDAAVIGVMEDQDMVYEEPQNLFANKFERNGAVFTGWNTKADGSGTAYKDEQSVKNLTTANGGKVTLYAQWKDDPQPQTALLTFDLDGGTLDDQTGVITVSVVVGDSVEMPAAPKREGYVFKYWKGSELYPGDKYTVKAGHTFTAVWEKVPDGEGGGAGDADGGNEASSDGSQETVVLKASVKELVPDTGDELDGCLTLYFTIAAAMFGALALHRRRQYVHRRLDKDVRKGAR